MALRVGLVALDCDDPEALADFWSRLTGWPVRERRTETWLQLVPPDGGVTLAFQGVEDYRPPTWPDDEVPTQEHLDLDVEDLDAAEAEALAAGAVKADYQPMPDRFRVFLDPAGHPFCLVEDTST